MKPIKSFPFGRITWQLTAGQQLSRFILESLATDYSKKRVNYRAVPPTQTSINDVGILRVLARYLRAAGVAIYSELDKIPKSSCRFWNRPCKKILASSAVTVKEPDVQEFYSTLILFVKTLALYKSFTYLLTYLLTYSFGA